MKLTIAHKKAINDQARRGSVGTGTYVEVALRASVKDRTLPAYYNLVFFNHDADDHDLVDLIRLADLTEIEDHPSGEAEIDCYVQTRDGFSHNLSASFKDGELVALGGKPWPGPEPVIVPSTVEVAYVDDDGTTQQPPKERRHSGPNVYPVGWKTWEDGEHYKTPEDVRVYARRLFTSPWCVRYYGVTPTPLVSKQRGQGGKSYGGHITIGFNGGYARQGIVLHELAHELAGPRHYHDKRFNRVWLELVRHEMGEAQAKKIQALYTEHRVRMDSPTKPVYTPEVARERSAKRRATVLAKPKLWRVEATIDGKTEEAAFESKTMNGALTIAKGKWGLELANVTRMVIWKGRATPVKKVLKHAAARSKPSLAKASVLLAQGLGMR